MPHYVQRTKPVFIKKEDRKVVEPFSLGQSRMVIPVPSEMVGNG